MNRGTHVPAATGFTYYVVTPVSLGGQRLPLALRPMRDPVIAWLVSSIDIDRGDGSVYTQVDVDPITAFGTPDSPFLLEGPDGILRDLSGTEIGGEIDAHRYFTEEIQRELR